MGLLDKVPSLPSIRKSSSSSSSSIRDDTSASSVSDSPKVKAKELNFGGTSAAPNSRLVVSAQPDSPRQSSAKRASKAAASSSEESASEEDAASSEDEPVSKPKRQTSAPPAVERRSSSGSGKLGGALAAVGLGGGSKKGAAKDDDEDEPKAVTRKSRSKSESAKDELSMSDDEPPPKAKSKRGAAVVKKGKPTAESDESEDDYEYASPEDESGSGSGSGSDSDDGAAVKEKRGKTVATPRKRTKKGKPMNQLTAADVKLSEGDVREDIDAVWEAMHLFMNSRMIESEDICLSAADHRLYFSVGYTLIQCIKSLMTFEPEDLGAAVQCCKDTLIIAQLLRKSNHGIGDRFGKVMKGTISAGAIKNMTVVERHAELVTAECMLLKAIIGIIYSGDFIAFLKEALNMRNAYATYRELSKFVEQADKGGEDTSIDQDFRSGVYLGNGLISIVLSLLPGKVLKLMTVFGFTGDREWGLKQLQAAGKWSSDPSVTKPGMKGDKEGIRRQVCDLALLFHHLVISTYLPVTGVDISMAEKILEFNLARYPEGVFWLYMGGRLSSTQTLGNEAVKRFNKAIKAQREYIQLQHICHWDLALTHIGMGEWEKALDCFTILDKESNWSKAIYAYAKAAMMYEAGQDPKAVGKIMAQVPDLMQRIAGKSIPLEKFVARKAKKFIEQGNRLLCPGIEFGYFINALGMAPRWALFEQHLDNVSTALAKLHKCKDPANYGKSSEEFWDDYCLAHLLRGIILRMIAFPEAHCKPDPKKSQIAKAEAGEQAEISFRNVFKHGRDITHDHQSVLFAHYELGRLFDFQKEDAKAKAEYSLLLDHFNKLELSPNRGKGKVSLQNMAILRTNAAYEALKERE